MNHFIQGTDGRATLHSLESALRGLVGEEKRLVAMSTISVVSRLAVEFEEDEVRSDLMLIGMILRYLFSDDTVDCFNVVTTPTVRGTDRCSGDFRLLYSRECVR